MLEVNNQPRVDFETTARLAETTERLQETTEDTIARTADIVKAVAIYANDFDHILVSGSSGIMSLGLLLAAGTPSSKMHYLDEYANAMVYRKDFPGTYGIRFTERVHRVTQLIEGLGINLANHPSVCSVDECVDTGEKAARYFDVFSRIDSIHRFGFATFSARQYASRGINLVYRDKQRACEGHLYYPPQLSRGNYADVDDLMREVRLLGWSLSPRRGIDPVQVEQTKTVMRDFFQRVSLSIQSEG